MAITSTAPEPLAKRLQSLAQAEKVPIDKLVSRLLERGLARWLG